jgi:hypothetical protein
MILAKERERRGRNTHREILEVTTMQSSKASANLIRNLNLQGQLKLIGYLHPRLKQLETSPSVY